jgi:cytidylate kinase
MYRWVAWSILQENISHLDEEKVTTCAKKLSFSYEYNSQKEVFEIVINWVNREKEIRTQEVATIVSTIAQYPWVRSRLATQQKKLWKQWWVVFDWRDCWTVIAPHAELKIHLVCDPGIRALRRQEQYKQEWKDVSLESIKKNLYERDQKDLYGPNATSSIAEDAITVDTSHLTIDEQIQKIVDLAKELL